MPPILDPLRIFAPGSPIPLVVLHHLVGMAAAALPGYAAAAPAVQAELRLFVQHAIAAYNPGDTQEAMNAASLVTLRAQAMEAFRLADDPATPANLGLRHRTLGGSISRCLEQGERRGQRARVLRLKEAETPSERSGWWFCDASLPAPEHEPAAASDVPQDPMHRETATQRAAVAAPVPQDPMHRETDTQRGAVAAPVPQDPMHREPPCVPGAPAVLPRPALPHGPGQVDATKGGGASRATGPDAPRAVRAAMLEPVIVLQPGRKLVPPDMAAGGPTRTAPHRAAG